MVKRDQSRTWPVLYQDKFIYEISTQYFERWQRKVRKTKFQQRAITRVKVGQTRPKSNLICNMSRQTHIWNFNSICQKMIEKSPENEKLAKGNNSCKSRSNATKVKLDLYYVKTNPYTKFQVNILKDDWEKSGKPSGLTDRQTDRQTDGQTDGRKHRYMYLRRQQRLYKTKITLSPWCVVVVTLPI